MIDTEIQNEINSLRTSMIDKICSLLERSAYRRLSPKVDLPKDTVYDLYMNNNALTASVVDDYGERRSYTMEYFSLDDLVQILAAL